MHYAILRTDIKQKLSQCMTAFNYQVGSPGGKPGFADLELYGLKEFSETYCTIPEEMAGLLRFTLTRGIIAVSNFFYPNGNTKKQVARRDQNGNGKRLLDTLEEDAFENGAGALIFDDTSDLLWERLLFKRGYREITNGSRSYGKSLI